MTNWVFHKVNFIHWIKYCEKTYEREGINYFWSIKNSTEILSKLKQKVFRLQRFQHATFLHFIPPCPTIWLKNNLLIWLNIRLNVKKFFIWPRSNITRRRISKAFIGNYALKRDRVKIQVNWPKKSILAESTLEKYSKRCFWKAILNV